MNQQTFLRSTVAMSALGLSRGNLTHAGLWQAALLTLTILSALPSHFCRADPLPPQENADVKDRLKEIQTYVRKEALSGVKILPGTVRDTLGWFSNGWHSVNMSSSDNLDGDSVPMQAAAQTEESDLNMPQVSSTYHHKGFLPTHDAMMMGIGLKQDIASKKLQFTLRPFYGQSWHSLRHYWGNEMAMNIDKRADDMPWGKIAIGYVSGDDTMTDHGSGIEMHGDVDLTNGWQFTSGIRQNSAAGDSNYLMLRWKLSLDNP